MARALLLGGDVERSAATLERAEALATSMGAVSWRPHLGEIRAGLARARGDEKTRRVRLEQARDLFGGMGATGHAARLARELGSGS